LKDFFFLKEPVKEPIVVCFITDPPV
jgi:hypothetical protein